MSDDIVHEPYETKAVFAHNRVFLNHTDQYNARHIAEFLTDQIIGGLKHVETFGEDEKGLLPSMMLNQEKYEVIGTVKNLQSVPTEDISFVVSETDAKNYEREIISTGFVIFDITRDANEIPQALHTLNILVKQIEFLKEKGPKTFLRHSRQFVFILMSNVLTWAKTKPIDPDDPDLPFTEADYRKRQAHSNAKEMIACEREVVRIGRKYKEVLKTYVLCCGIPYGHEEDSLELFFKMAWDNKELPILLPGNNFIPLIHINDVAKIIYAIIEILPKRQYIVAIEQVPSTLGQIMRALSRSLGAGVHEIVKEEAFNYSSITQSLYDIMTLNLIMEPAFILDELGISYKNDLNFVQNIDQIVDEFRLSRHLTPMRVLLHGPIASGRTTLSNLIADYTGVHYVNVGVMIEETRKKLLDQIKAAGKEVSDEESSGAEEDKVDVKVLEEKLRILETALENNNGVLPDAMVLSMMRTFLGSNACQNQGYVLDAYPKTLQQTRDLFRAEMDGEYGEDEEDDIGLVHRSIIPQYVITLEATDEYVIDRIMNNPEKIAIGTHNEEERIMQSLKAFRANNTEDNTLLNFFDEHEIHPIRIDVMELEQNFEAIMEIIRKIVGHPVGFEATPEEQQDLQQCREEANRLKLEQEAIEEKLREQQALEEYEKKMKERIELLDQLQAEEEKLLMAQCEPLRNYLMTYIFPTLTKGMLEVARVRPTDPVDYLAKFLFRHNPEGKMFDPTYTRNGELIQRRMRETVIEKDAGVAIKLCK